MAVLACFFPENPYLKKKMKHHIIEALIYTLQKKNRSIISIIFKGRFFFFIWLYYWRKKDLSCGVPYILKVYTLVFKHFWDPCIDMHDWKLYYSHGFSQKTPPWRFLMSLIWIYSTLSLSRRLETVCQAEHRVHVQFFLKDFTLIKIIFI